MPILKAFDDFEIFPIWLGDGLLGVYCHSTCEKPVISIDIGNHLIACARYDMDFEKALNTTILHELKHGWQEWYNKPFDEVEAEDFAYNSS